MMFISPAKTGLSQTRTVVFIAATTLVPAGFAVQGDASTDTAWAQKMLAERGVDVALLQALDQKGVFPKGNNLLDVSVNGEFKGAFNIVVSPQGHLCFTPPLFRQLGLKQPTEQPSAGGHCMDWASLDPEVSIQTDTQNLAVSIVVPQQVLLGAEAIRGEEGGAAAMLNYSYFSSLSRNAGSSSRYSYLSLTDGANINNWVVRSSQQFSQSPAGLTIDLNSLYAERSLRYWQKNLRIGQIGISDTLFSLGDILGAELVSDDALQQEQQGGAVVEGIAATAQARVEVRQYGVLLHSTLVPAGPFRLAGIPLKNGNGDLEVVVNETDGRQQRFVLPAAQFAGVQSSGAEGVSLAMGKLSQGGGAGQGIPALLTANYRWPSRHRLSAQLGGLFTRKYQSAALSLSHRMLQGLELATQIIATHDSYQHRQSARLSVSARYPLSDRVSLSASLTKNSPGYLPLSMAAAVNDDRSVQENLQYMLAASWAAPLLGNFTLSQSVASTWRAGSPSRYTMLSWGNRLKRADLSVNFSRSSGASGEKQLSFNLSMPLGEQHMNGYYRNGKGYSRAGSQFNGRLGQNMNYSVSAHRDLRQNQQSVQGGISSHLPYTHLAMTAAHSGAGSTNYSISGSGGAAMIGSQLLFTSASIGQTFGMVALSERQSGAVVITPSGKARTDWRGLALVANIPAWRKVAIDLDTETLPKNSDVSNGHREVVLAQGSVKRLDYTILNNRRVLITLKLKDGSLLPRGSRVMDAQGSMITVAIDDGVIYLENADQRIALQIEIADSDRSCRFQGRLSEPNNDQPYQKISGICE